MSFTDDRLRLLANGYLPLPLQGKNPDCRKGWQNGIALNEKYIRDWERDFPYASNTGILARTTPCLDLDVLDEDTVEEMEAYVVENHSDHGFVLPRIGKAPKRAIPFRTDEPFKKIQRVLVAPNGVTGQKIEFLADGQQFAALGVHPDTNGPYYWPLGSPLDFARDALPYIRGEDAETLVEAMAKIAASHGYNTSGKGAGTGRKAAPGGGTQVDMDDLMQQFISGASFHPAGLSMIGKWAQSGIAQDAVLNFLEHIFLAAKQARYSGRWGELVKMVDDIYAKEASKNLGRPVAVEDFYAYRPEHKFIFVPTGSLWPQASVNAALPMQGGVKPATLIDVSRAVEQMTWAPGKPQIIRDEYIVNGGWMTRPNAQVFNLYRPPRPHLGRHDQAQPWIDHLHAVYPSEGRHIEQWLACRVQRPHTKINHALVLGGSQGIGKDTLLEGPRHAVGHWNCATVSPIQLLGRFNSFLKSVLLVVSEARDLGEINRPNFYEHTKQIIAAPPEVLYIDEKNTHPYYIPNLVGVIITTNHKTAGIYLPPDDRRHFVAWSPLEINSFDDAYWRGIWGFYFNGGFEHVAAYLASLDISGFDPYEPPPHTDAFHEIVVNGTATEIGEMADALRLLGDPDTVTLDDLTGVTTDAEFAAWIRDRKNRRMLPRWMEAAGYVIVRNPDSKQGLWSVSGKQQIVYGKANMAAQQRYLAARRRARL